MSIRTFTKKQEKYFKEVTSIGALTLAEAKASVLSVEEAAALVEEHIYSNRHRSLATAKWTLKHAERSNESADDCIIWAGSLFGDGYGQSTYKGVKYNAHRMVATVLRGEDAVLDMDVHHVCCIARDCVGGKECAHRACVNPLHQAVVTESVNVQLFRNRPCICGEQFPDEDHYYLRLQGGYLKRDCKVRRAEAAARGTEKRRLKRQLASV